MFTLMVLASVDYSRVPERVDASVSHVGVGETIGQHSSMLTTMFMVVLVLKDVRRVRTVTATKRCRVKEVS